MFAGIFTHQFDEMPRGGGFVCSVWGRQQLQIRLPEQTKPPPSVAFHRTGVCGDGNRTDSTHASAEARTESAPSEISTEEEDPYSRKEEKTSQEGSE